jgi:hypothetical protein
MPYPSKEARNAALKARRRSPGHQIHLCTQRRLRLIAEIEKIRNKIIEIVTLNSEFKSEIPVRLVEETLRPFPIRRISSPDLTEDGAWQIENQSTQTPEQHARLVKYKAYCQQENIDPFPHHKEEIEESQDITEEPEEVSAVEYTPEDETEFLTLMAKRDKAQGQVNPTGTWSEEENVRLCELFHRRQQHEQEARR